MLVADVKQCIVADGKAHNRDKEDVWICGDKAPTCAHTFQNRFCTKNSVLGFAVTT